MEKGRVKWFNDLKGYGFIEGEAEGKDIFVHYSVIDSSGFRSLLDGEDVLYEKIVRPQGPAATRVLRLLHMEAMKQAQAAD